MASAGFLDMIYANRRSAAVVAWLPRAFNFSGSPKTKIPETRRKLDRARSTAGIHSQGTGEQPERTDLAAGSPEAVWLSSTLLATYRDIPC